MVGTYTMLYILKMKMSKRKGQNRSLFRNKSFMLNERILQIASKNHVLLYFPNEFSYHKGENKISQKEIKTISQTLKLFTLLGNFHRMS